MAEGTKLEQNFKEKFEQLQNARRKLDEINGQAEQVVTIIRRLEGACAAVDELVKAEAAEPKSELILPGKGVIGKIGSDSVKK